MIPALCAMWSGLPSWLSLWIGLPPPINMVVLAGPFRDPVLAVHREQQGQGDPRPLCYVERVAFLVVLVDWVTSLN